jgi:hypothetical protein
MCANANFRPNSLSISILHFGIPGVNWQPNEAHKFAGISIEYCHRESGGPTVPAKKEWANWPKCPPLSPADMLSAQKLSFKRRQIFCSGKVEFVDIPSPFVANNVMAKFRFCSAASHPRKMSYS